MDEEKRRLLLIEFSGSVPLVSMSYDEIDFAYKFFGSVMVLSKYMQAKGIARLDDLTAKDILFASFEPDSERLAEIKALLDE